MANSEYKNLSIDEIELDLGNPRIKHFLEIYNGEITAEALALALSTAASSSEKQMSFSSLRDSIKTSKGIIHPIIVNHQADGKFIVIEGNTRLQIYKDFYRDSHDEAWLSIPALVYEQLSTIEIHEIRLQSHLVGPREWEPYSKAKYLYELSVVEGIPMPTLIDLCGGRQSEIRKAIDTYMYMEQYYRPYVDRNGYEFTTRDFSKFQEFQSPSVKRSVLNQGFDEGKFAEWVADGNIDTALGVRELPEIMKNDEARALFLRKNLSEADKVVAASKMTKTDLSSYPMETLLAALFKQINRLEYDDVKMIATGEGQSSNNKLYLIRQLKNQIDFIIDQISGILVGNGGI